MSTKPWFVKDTDFANKISTDDMATFNRVCPERGFEKGETIFWSGEPATSLHIIAKGRVKLVTPTASGNECILAICGPQDFIGEAFMGEGARYRVDAVALSEVTTCPISRAQFLELAQQAPNFVLAFSEVLASHLFYCRDQLSSSYAPVKARLVTSLVEQAQRFGRPQENGWVRLEIELKHEELASLISATRVSVSMAMAELRDEGLVEGGRGDYLVNLEVLQDME